jgi:AraC family transcriptional regulator
MKSMLELPHVALWRIGSSFENEPHRHDDSFQLTVPVSGVCELTSERQSFRLGPGEALVQLPGEEHHFRLGGTDSVIIFQMKISSMTELWSGQEQLLLQRQTIAVDDLGELWRSWTNRLLTGEADEIGMISEETECAVYAYLQKTLQTGYGRGTPSSGDAAWRIAEGIGAWRNVMDYIHDHYKEQLSLDELAALAGVSKYHFVRQFKARTGNTPYQYVLSLRIAEAKRLLGAGRTSVTGICFDLGFASLSSFYRMFGRATGMTPEQYRKETGI